MEKIVLAINGLTKYDRKNQHILEQFEREYAIEIIDDKHV